MSSHKRNENLFHLSNHRPKKKQKGEQKEKEQKHSINTEETKDNDDDNDKSTEYERERERENGVLREANIGDVNDLSSLYLFILSCSRSLIRLDQNFDTHISSARSQSPPPPPPSSSSSSSSSPLSWLELKQRVGAVSLWAFVERLATPFVRRSSLFLSYLLRISCGSQCSSSSILSSSTPSSSFLSSSTPPTLTFGMGLQRLIYDWCVRFFTSKPKLLGNGEVGMGKTSDGGVPSLGRLLNYGFKFELIRLPPLFQTLLHSLTNRPCDYCQTVLGLSEGVVCLLCGVLTCRTSCLNQHVRSCDGMSGMFCVLKRSDVLVIHDSNTCYWGSLYLDEYGEEDISLSRGKPLYLNENRYQQLLSLYLNQGISDFIARQTQQNEPTRIQIRF